MGRYAKLGMVGLVVILGVVFLLKIISPVGEVVQKIAERPLDKYTINNLSLRSYGGEIIIDEPVATESAYTAYKFHYDSDAKKVTGLAHIPNGCTKCPTIIQLRGYVDREIYKSGIGTQRSAQVFAKNGFITLAPDFLGYGESDMPSENVFEERFQTYVAALNLLAATDKWGMANGEIGIWGHSNGGQIALTILEVLGKPIPTSLWAPVTKPFPYSILYYTDEFEDRGKFLRKELAKFEEDYDVELYSLPNYLDRIAAPIQLHQGIADEAVPYKWNREFVKRIQDKEIYYYEYPGADHNLMPDWNTVVKRDVEFFRRLTIGR